MQQQSTADRARVRVFDTTLRDGAQTPGVQFTVRRTVTRPRGGQHPVHRVVVNAAAAPSPPPWTSRAEIVRHIEESVRAARGQTHEVECRVTGATHADPVFVRQCIYAAVTAGATRVRIGDGGECSAPDALDRLVRDVTAFVEGRVVVSAVRRKQRRPRGSATT